LLLWYFHCTIDFTFLKYYLGLRVGTGFPDNFSQYSCTTLAFRPFLCSCISGRISLHARVSPLVVDCCYYLGLGDLMSRGQELSWANPSFRQGLVSLGLEGGVFFFSVILPLPIGKRPLVVSAQDNYPPFPHEWKIFFFPFPFSLATADLHVYPGGDWVCITSPSGLRLLFCKEVGSHWGFVPFLYQQLSPCRPAPLREAFSSLLPYPHYFW